MAEWIYTKDRLPKDYHLKWVAVHNTRTNYNDLDKAYYSPITNKWYDEHDYVMLDNKIVYAWRDIEKPLIPVYRED